MREFLLRLTNHLERRLQSDRLHVFPLSDRVERIDLFHLSTIDHLVIFLERMYHRAPNVHFRFASHMTEDASPDALRVAATIPLPESVERLTFADLQAADPAADLSIILLGPRHAVEPPKWRAGRSAFTGSGARTKIVILGDGSVWRASRWARMRRVPLRLVLRFLRPMRDRIEARLLDARIAPDSWLDGSRSERRRLLSTPTRIDQDLQHGVVIKSDLLAADDDGDATEDYHDVEFPSERPDWDNMLAVYQERRWRNMRKVGVNPPAGTENRTLDVGCGTGGLATKLAAEGFKTLGVDRCEWAISLARRDFPHVDFAVDTFENLHRWTDRFDLLTLSHTLEHARDDIGLLKTLRGLLAPGGKIYIEVPWFSRETAKLRPDWIHQMDHFREYTKPGLRALVESAGFAILKHDDSLADDGQEPYQFLLATPTD